MHYAGVAIKDMQRAVEIQQQPFRYTVLSAPFEACFCTPNKQLIEVLER